jgi:hypothetical protein
MDVPQGLKRLRIESILVSSFRRVPSGRGAFVMLIPGLSLRFHPGLLSRRPSGTRKVGPAGAEARVYFESFSARLKSCPDAFSSTEVVT